MELFKWNFYISISNPLLQHYDMIFKNTGLGQSEQVRALPAPRPLQLPQF